MPRTGSRHQGVVAAAEARRRPRVAGREGGCLWCGGRLDVADYPRKPRGGSSELGDDYDVRRSSCVRRWFTSSKM